LLGYDSSIFHKKAPIVAELRTQASGYLHQKKIWASGLHQESKVERSLF
jgi:hypothetical protein